MVIICHLLVHFKVKTVFEHYLTSCAPNYRLSIEQFQVHLTHFSTFNTLDVQFCILKYIQIKCVNTVIVLF